KKTEKIDKRIELLFELANAHSMGEVEKSIFHANQALKLAYQINDDHGVAYSNFLLGKAYQLINSDSAVHYYNNAYEVFNRLDCKDSVIKTLNNLGVLYKNRGEYKSSLETFFQALKI